MQEGAAAEPATPDAVADTSVAAEPNADIETTEKETKTETKPAAKAAVPKVGS